MINEKNGTLNGSNERENRPPKMNDSDRNIFFLFEIKKWEFIFYGFL